MTHLCRCCQLAVQSTLASTPNNSLFIFRGFEVTTGYSSPVELLVIANCSIRLLSYEPTVSYLRSQVPYTYTTLLNKNSRIVWIQHYRSVPSCCSDGANIPDSFRPINHSLLGEHFRSFCYIAIPFN